MSDRCFFLCCTSCSLISTQTALNVFLLYRVGVFCCSAMLRADNHCAFTVPEPPAHFSNIFHHSRSTGMDSNFIYFSLFFIFLSCLTCSGHPANLLTFYILSNLISYTCLFWPCFSKLGFQHLRVRCSQWQLLVWDCWLRRYLFFKADLISHTLPVQR